MSRSELVKQLQSKVAIMHGQVIAANDSMAECQRLMTAILEDDSGEPLFENFERLVGILNNLETELEGVMGHSGDAVHFSL